MYILVDTEDVVIAISKTIDYEENGNVIVEDDNVKIAYAKYIVKKVYEVQEIPENVQVQKYCYTEEKGFYKNENYREYFSEEDRITALEEVVNSLLGF